VTTILRPVTQADLPTVGALHIRSRRAAYRHILPADALAAPGEEAMGDYWTQRWTYERGTHRLTVAERDDRVVGFTYLGPDPDQDGPVGLLCAIHVEPDEVGRGTGRLLMVDALDATRRRGWLRAVLWVLRDNTRARRFYEHGGWAADGTERDETIGGTLTRQLRYTRRV
jgi:GNAT superfamily N-acetyltransferase